MKINLLIQNQVEGELWVLNNPHNGNHNVEMETLWKDLINSRVTRCNFAIKQRMIIIISRDKLNVSLKAGLWWCGGSSSSQSHSEAAAPYPSIVGYKTRALMLRCDLWGADVLCVWCQHSYSALLCRASSAITTKRCSFLQLGLYSPRYNNPAGHVIGGGLSHLLLLRCLNAECAVSIGSTYQ